MWGWYLFFLAVFYLFLSFRLTSVPPGINIDESSIGYNASLIAGSLRDENDRFLPVFTLTLGGKDWKQPVRIYLTALIFRLLGPSYFNLRLISVLFALASTLIFYKILRLFFSVAISLTGVLLLVTAPSILIQSHLALENIDLLPFFLLWLYFFLSYSLKPDRVKLFWAGVFLGLSFYAYKGMRAFLPVYLGLSLAYGIYECLFQRKGRPQDLVFFLMGIVPFLLPIPWLQRHYAGAVYDPAILSSPSFFDEALVFLSSFDFSFLFLKGDKMLIHSTGRQGMFLLPNLVLFFLGFWQLAKEKKPQFYFVFLSLILTPLLLGTVGSVYRASRLLVLVPLMTFIFTLGIKWLWEIKNTRWKVASLILFCLMLSVSFFDFVSYYWRVYPRTVAGDFSPNFNQAMKELRRLSLDQEKAAYIESSDYRAHKSDLDFFSEVYFPDGKPKIWAREKEQFPEKGLVLTGIEGSQEVINYQKIPALQSGARTFYVVGK